MLGWENGTILDHDPSYNSIFQVNARYLPGINCDIVDSFLMDVFPPDCLELAEELIGYCLIPSNAFQVAFILLGGGANGKSTFLRVLMELVGKNSVSNVSLQQLSENNFAAANLFGKLLNIHPDIPSRNLADSSLFKSITGGDRIMAERKYGHPFEFEPFAKLLFSCNELPRSYDKSMAFFRRLVIIPFPNQFLAGKADPDIFDKLITAEAMSAWLNHGIVGLKRLFEKKAFTIPETVKLAAADYQLQCDSALSFIKEYLEPLDGANLQKTFLYKKYCEWSSANNIRRPEFPRYFNIAMTLEGYRESVETHVNGANKIWRNVRLNEDLEGF